MTEYFDIAIATDTAYLALAKTAISSLLESNKTTLFRIHLLSNGLRSEDTNALKQLFATNSSKLYIYPIDNLGKRLGVNVPQTISITSYARLLIASILPQYVTRVLYIDCDVFFNGNISELKHFNLGSNIVAGVLDPIIGNSYRREIGIPKSEFYINAGVLLIPLDKWRSLKMSDLFLSYLIKHHGFVHHHDQGIINAVCCGQKSLLHPKFNVMSNCFSYGWINIHNAMANSYYNYGVFKDAINNPAIIHFTGADMGRPWTSDCSHPYKELFLKTYNSFDNSSIHIVKLSLMHRLEKQMFRCLPFLIFKYTMRIINNIAYLKHMYKRKICNKTTT